MFLDKYVHLNKRTLEGTIPVTSVCILGCSGHSEAAQSGHSIEWIWVFAESAWPVQLGWLPLSLCSWSQNSAWLPNHTNLLSCAGFMSNITAILSQHVLKLGFTYKSCSTLYTQLLKHLRNLNKCKCGSIVGLESTKKRDRFSESNHNISCHLSLYCCFVDSHFAIRFTGLSILKHNVNCSITSWAELLLAGHRVQTGSVSSSLSLSILFTSTEGLSGDCWSETEQ